MFSKLQMSVKQFFASITNTKPVSPMIPQNNSQKLFIPTFDDLHSVLFWVFLAGFFSIYGLAVRSDLLQNFTQTRLAFTEYFLTNACVILLNIGYIHVNTDTLLKKTYIKGSLHVLAASLLLTPLATVIANFLEKYIIGTPFVLADVLRYMVFNTVANTVIFSILLYYFSQQHQKIADQYSIYQQNLIEQNEQLKARLTPHFFFNMLNTVQYLVEENPQEAENMVRSVSNLYRASFNGSQEIGFLDEIEICKHYLNIEMYRFAEKLEVIWQLPDEDMLYEMTISSLTLQFTLEKMIIFVVENTNSLTNLEIAVDWEYNLITIEVKANLLGGFSDALQQHIQEKLSFQNQTHILQEIYGKSANIHYEFDNDTLTTKIVYPFFDVAL